MGLPWLCLFGFLTGSGGCAAFFGALKTGTLRAEQTVQEIANISLSCSELPFSKRHGDRFPPRCFRSQRLLLFVNIVHRLPR